VDQTPDDQLIEAARAGDPEARRELVVRHQAAVLALAAQLTPGPADRDDIAQEVFVRALSRLESFDASRGSFRTWLAAIALGLLRLGWIVKLSLG